VDRLPGDGCALAEGIQLMADTRTAPESAPGILARPGYRSYVLGLLFLTYVLNTIDRNSVLSLLLQDIKAEFGASDTQLGLLGGIPFAFFYAFLGIPLAMWADRSSRRNVLALAVGMWSAMTALCGLALNFVMLFFSRVGVAVGEAGGSPPSHSLISDYFPKSLRGTAFSIFALGVPIGTAAGNFIGGWANDTFGWRMTFVLVGVPGVLLALMVRMTIREPPRGYADRFLTPAGQLLPPGDVLPPKTTPAPPVLEVLSYLLRKASFRHLSLAAALHSVAWYAGSVFNAPFLIRSHGFTSTDAGFYLGIIAIVGGLGTFFGGVAADRLSAWKNDRRWYMLVPGIACLIMVPFHWVTYLHPDMSTAFPAFCVMTFLAAVFFGPSFAMTQALAALRMRSVATALLLFVQTLIGFGIGPWAAGALSDRLAPAGMSLPLLGVVGQGTDSLRWGIVIVGLVNVWSAAHYFHGARFLLADLAASEKLASESA
jgi:predicted MFS family arabinose efflux permease